MKDKIKSAGQLGQAEKALMESEERFKILSEATFEGIAITDKGKILYARNSHIRLIHLFLPMCS